MRSFNLRANIWYKIWGATPTNILNPLTDLVTSLAGGIAVAENKFSEIELGNSSTLSPGALDFLNT